MVMPTCPCIMYSEYPCLCNCCGIQMQVLDDDGGITDPFIRNYLDLLCFLLSGLPADGTIAAEVAFMFNVWPPLVAVAPPHEPRCRSLHSHLADAAALESSRCGLGCRLGSSLERSSSSRWAAPSRWSTPWSSML